MKSAILLLALIATAVAFTTSIIVPGIQSTSESIDEVYRSQATLIDLE